MEEEVYSLSWSDTHGTGVVAVAAAVDICVPEATIAQPQPQPQAKSPRWRTQLVQSDRQWENLARSRWLYWILRACSERVPPKHNTLATSVTRRQLPPPAVAFSRAHSDQRHRTIGKEHGTGATTVGGGA